MTNALVVQHRVFFEYLIWPTICTGSATLHWAKVCLTPVIETLTEDRGAEGARLRREPACCLLKTWAFERGSALKLSQMKSNYTTPWHTAWTITHLAVVFITLLPKRLECCLKKIIVIKNTTLNTGNSPPVF